MQLGMKGKLALVLICAVALVYSSPVAAETLEIPGTGACETILNELASAFNQQNPEDRIVIPPSSGSGGGIRLVGTGENNVGRVARPIKTEEMKYNLSYLVFAMDPVIFVSGKGVGVNNLTQSRLVDIFSGRIRNWKEVGGKDAPIRVLVREPGDSSLNAIIDSMPDFAKIVFDDNAKILYHDHEMVETLNKYRMSIGWVTLSTANTGKNSFRPLAIDDVFPSRENTLTGKYRIIGRYALVYKEKQLSPLARKFIDFIFSDSGRGIFVKSGLIPIKKR